jgi:serine/threonine-protein kinase
LQHLARAQALAPQSAEVLGALGVVYRRQLRFDEAITVFERAAQYDPANSNLFDNLAGTYWWAGRNDEAQAAYERALALNPENEAAAIHFSDFLVEQSGDVESARRVLRGRGPRLQIQMAATYWLERDYEKALRLIEELPADSPAFGRMEGLRDELLGLYLHSASQDERARPLLELARRRHVAALGNKTLDPRRVAFISIRLARIEVVLGNRDAAVQVAERGAQSDAVTRDPIYRASYRRRLAEIYAQAGRSEEAIALISELLKSSSALSGITPITLRLSPDWDPLREDTRFQALLREHPTDDNEKVVKP